MTIVEASYLAFACASGVLFLILPVRAAILTVFMGGWLLLPVGIYPQDAAEARFPWWITGVAVPSDMLLTKGWVPAVTALFWAVATGWRQLQDWRPSVLDLPMALWCLWPLFHLLQPDAGADPAPWLAATYLMGTWGATWLLGRIWFATAAGTLHLVRGLAIAGLLCLPFALLESGLPPNLYGLLFEPHPFRADGVGRPMGFRPIGFFEHGNQYAIWVAACAIAAVWVVGADAASRRSWLFPLAAGASVVLTLASQSRGAVLLLALFLIVLVFWQSRLVRRLGVGLMLVTVVLLAVHLSGLLPLQDFVRRTDIGRQVLSGLREAGLGSFTWRFGQDVRSLQMILETPLIGAGRWDWSHPVGTRPWGLWLLAAGQFGLVAVGLALTGLILPAMIAFRAHAGHAIWKSSAAVVPLGLIALMTVADAWFNSWVFFPGVMAAGALVAARSSAHPAASRHRPARGTPEDDLDQASE